MARGPSRMAPARSSNATAPIRKARLRKNDVFADLDRDMMVRECDGADAKGNSAKVHGVALLNAKGAMGADFAQATRALRRRRAMPAPRQSRPTAAVAGSGTDDATSVRESAVAPEPQLYV